MRNKDLQSGDNGKWDVMPTVTVIFSRLLKVSGAQTGFMIFAMVRAVD